MQSWQKFIETKAPLNESSSEDSFYFAKMAADTLNRAIGSSQNRPGVHYFMEQCEKAMQYLQKAMQMAQAKPDLEAERAKLMKAYQRGIITDEEMEQRLAQLGA